MRIKQLVTCSKETRGVSNYSEHVRSKKFYFGLLGEAWLLEYVSVKRSKKLHHKRRSVLQNVEEEHLKELICPHHRLCQLKFVCLEERQSKVESICPYIFLFQWLEWVQINK